MKNKNNRSLWHFLYGSRPVDDELAYRQHYLANDIRQIKVMSYSSMGFMLALTFQDVFQLGDNPALMTGIVLRFILIVIGLGVMWSLREDQSPRSVDIKVIIFTSIVATVLITVHFFSGVSPVRMVGVATLFIMAVHIGYPSYAATLLLSVTIALTGEFAILFSGVGLEEFRLIIPTVLAFAVFICMLGSSYYHRTRYQAFKAISEVKTLTGMLPICANCKKIRDDQGYYRQIESYITENSEAEFSHGICPDCVTELCPDIEISRE